MPINTKIRINQRWSYITILGFIAFLNAIGFVVLSRSYSEIDDKILLAKNALIALGEIESNLKDAESGQRGYLLTGSNIYLEPYWLGVGSIKTNLTKLDKYLLDGVSRKAYADILSFSTLKLQELEITINLRRNKGLNESLVIVKADTGKAYMDVLRLRFIRIRFVQESVINTYHIVQNQIDIVRKSFIAILLLCCLSIIWLLIDVFREELKLKRKITEAQEHQIKLKESTVDTLRNLAIEKERELSLRIHDWKNPLTNILASVDLIQNYRDKWSLEKQDRYFKQIIINIYILLDGFNDALLVARAEANRLEIHKIESDLVCIVRESIKSVEYKIKKHTIVLYIENTELWYNCDANLIKRAIINLLENALKHTSDGEIAICLVKTDFDVIIQIADQGKGIPQEDLKRLFNAFERGDTKAKGTGLGLAVVSHCANAHHGKVTVESEPNLTIKHPNTQRYKTLFTLILPIDAP